MRNPSKPHGATRANYPVFSASDVAQWPPISWLISGVIQRQSAAIIYGESRVGKSFLALDLACKLASGEPWFGYPATRCRVVFFAAESPAGLRARLQAIREYTGREIPDTLTFMRSPVDICNPEDAEKLVQTIDGTADVLIIDTLNAVSSDNDENSSTGMGRVLAPVRRLVLQSGCTVILIHHCGWSEHDHPRGHSSLPAAMDTRIQVKRAAGHPSWRVKGQREGADTEFHGYALRVIHLPNDGGASCVVDPLSPQPAPKVRPSPATRNQQTVLRVAEELQRQADAAPLTEDRLATEAARHLEADHRHKKQRAREAITALVQQGFLRKDPFGGLST